ncbi:MAG TPA: FAD-dependent oxidoreductase [Syntrophorhabdaceae bacterium]|nr:FAD-dependent oxidoreductase [Syntrophorhabdaceae bacterium]HOT41364.1 FAD-dependent oxidoreductase [Syntrophorhabdaceae bacterium]HPC66658.1 FAD-dependent oxidoreductase [Syntrophorhabdaceae bacterium]HQE79464.1 FAD-dependent oxidoreductase [Syntrophorhabdaceae bacterium]HQH44313.1 FAD-dependent oxidoreductase [Syntrophorhabdaceae bacterium]
MPEVIVIGAGLAGIMAAYHACMEGADVILIDRGSTGLGTNSALSNGVFAGPTSTYREDEYIRDTMEIGRYLNRESYVRLIAHEVNDGIKFLRSLGLHIVESHTTYALKASSADIIPGVTLMKTMVESLKNLPNLKILNNFYVTAILKNEDKACGVLGFDKDGMEMEIYASSTILATGGAGAIYLRNDNQKTIMGQGYRLAAEAGLELNDMEFVQFFPLVVAEERLGSVILYPPTPKEAKLINNSGEDILKKYGFEDIDQAILKKRDEFSIMLFKERELYGQIYIDFTGVPEHAWHEHPMGILSKLKIDLRNRPVAISPAAHFFMGGIEIDARCQTKLPGLFACGEVVWGLHGANRRGGNALTECLVTGKIAGKNAADIKNKDVPLPTPLTFKVRQSHITNPSTNKRLSLTEVRKKIREIAWNSAGVIRSQKGVTDGISSIDLFYEQLRSFSPANIKEKRLKEDLLSACLTLKAILTASLARQESRGSFFRDDFQKEDNVNWRKNSSLLYDMENHQFKTFAKPCEGLD